MDLQLIKKMCEKREGGIKKLAADINMSEANLHRCINNNKIQATDLENIANRLNVRVGIFFGENNDSGDEIIRLREEICRLKKMQAFMDGNGISELWMKFMANQQQYQEIMKEMMEIYRKEN